ncbi:MAG: carboxypeptidase-like regulatory domain-containing protein [Bacteroidales bacterium]|nr:carboxypeptidase-like regulatory domain-containing protein [Bacteroidales bacterium]
MKAKSLVKSFLIFIFSILLAASGRVYSNTPVQKQQETITISGRATDFDGNPIDSCRVSVYYTDFSTAYSAYTDNNGYYSIPEVSKGKYMAVYAMRPEEYPRQLEVPEKDMRLEFWAWNIIADKDLTINPRYHRLELYGTTVFKQNGGYPGIMIYTRPMSLGRMLSYGQKMWENKSEAEAAEIDISVEPDEIEFKVYADDVPVAVQSVQPVMEYVGGGRQMAYLIYVDLPETTPDKYYAFRIEAFNRAYGGEKGENVYFYEIPAYKSGPQ